MVCDGVCGCVWWCAMVCVGVTVCGGVVCVCARAHARVCVCQRVVVCDCVIAFDCV